MIVIQPRPGEDVADVLRLAYDLVDDRTTVRTGGGGVVVTEEVAWDYLCAVLGRIPAPPPTPDAYFVGVTYEPAADDSAGEAATPAPQAPPGDGTSTAATDDAAAAATGDAAPPKRPRKTTRAAAKREPQR